MVLTCTCLSVANQTTGLRIGGYTGSMGVDLWDRPKWLEQLEAHDVFVMTPAILVRLLMHNYITMLQVPVQSTVFSRP